MANNLTETPEQIKAREEFCKLLRSPLTVDSILRVLRLLNFLNEETVANSINGDEKLFVAMFNIQKVIKKVKEISKNKPEKITTEELADILKGLNLRDKL